MSGDFPVLIDPMAGTFGNPIPFSVEFAAEVDPTLVPVLCQ